MFDMDVDLRLRCWKCGHHPAVHEYLNGLSRWWPWLETLQRRCRQCDYPEEIQLQPGRILLGYLYAAGTAHFAAMESVEVEGLEVQSGPASITLRWGANTWQLPAEAPPAQHPVRQNR